MAGQMARAATLLALVALAAAQADLSSLQTSPKDNAALWCANQNNIVQIGSSTVFAAAQAASIKYPNPLLAPQAIQTGTTLGFQNFFAYSSDVATASRRISGADYNASDCDGSLVTSSGVTGPCQGRFPVGVQIGYDLLTIIGNPTTAWLPNSLSLDQIKKIFSGNFLWGDVFQGAQNLAIMLYVPDASSGVVDYFQAATGTTLTALQGYSDERQIVDAVAADPASIGLVSRGTALSAGSIVKVLAIDGFDPLNNATSDTAANYLLTRPLLKYYDTSAASASKTFGVLEFICGLLTPEGQKVTQQAGYISLNAADLTAANEQVKCADRIGTYKNVALTGISAQMGTCRAAQTINVISEAAVDPIAQRLTRVQPNPLTKIIARPGTSEVAFRDLIVGAIPLILTNRELLGLDYDAFSCSGDSGVSPSADQLESVATQPCQGVLPQGIKLGYDLVTFVASAQNKFFTKNTDLTADDVFGLFLNRVPANQLSIFNNSNSGVTAPTTPFNLYVPATSTGTAQKFVAGTGQTDIKGYTDVQQQLDDLYADPNGVGYVSLGQVDPARVTPLKYQGFNPYYPSANYDLSNYQFKTYVWAWFDSFKYTRAQNDLLCYLLSADGQRLVEYSGFISMSQVSGAGTDVLKSQKGLLLC